MRTVKRVAEYKKITVQYRCGHKGIRVVARDARETRDEIIDNDLCPDCYWAEIEALPRRWWRCKDHDWGNGPGEATVYYSTGTVRGPDDPPSSGRGGNDNSIRQKMPEGFTPPAGASTYVAGYQLNKRASTARHE